MTHYRQTSSLVFTPFIGQGGKRGEERGCWKRRDWTERSRTMMCFKWGLCSQEEVHVSNVLLYSPPFCYPCRVRAFIPVNWLCKQIARLGKRKRRKGQQLSRESRGHTPAFFVCNLLPEFRTRRKEVKHFVFSKSDNLRRKTMPFLPLGTYLLTYLLNFKWMAPPPLNMQNSWVELFLHFRSI